MIRFSDSDGRKSRHTRASGWALVGTAAALSAISCSPAPKAGRARDNELPPTADRMVAAYPDLRSRRFRVLADFETPEQGTLFRRHSQGITHPTEVTVDKAQRETGVGSLKMMLADGSDRVVAAADSDRRWALYRDWSDYCLLLFSVYSPRDLGGFRFSVRSGTEMPLVYTHPPIFLSAGWNLLRIDLAEMAEVINLANVRAMQLWCEQLPVPTELYLDDVILADNERVLFGQARPQAGELYVKQAGRRLIAGVHDVFELTFADGRIRRWFDLAHDPERVHNLVGQGSLGPLPVVLNEPGEPVSEPEDLKQWSGLGLASRTLQSLFAANPLRAVIVGERRFGAPGASIAEDRIAHRWHYTIYRDGRVYVSCTGTARSDTFTPPGLGIAFGVDRDQRFERHVLQAEPSAEAATETRTNAGVLFDRPEPGRSDLLVVPARPLPLQTQSTGSQPYSGALWRFPEVDARFVFAGMVWLTDLNALEKARSLADDYAYPLPMAVDVGQLVRTDPGDFDNDGFSEGRGYYVLQLDGNVARVRVSASHRPRFAPTFRLIDAAGRDVWIYVNGRELKEVVRTDEGDLLFSVPDVETGEVLIEIASKVRGE